MMQSSESNQTGTRFDADAARESLLDVALPYAESLRSRPGAISIMLYGSLARGGITPFSDVDLALLYDSDPRHRIEHRMVRGTKVDVISFPLDEIEALLDPVPRSLDVGFPLSYVLESLLLAKDDTILYDPTGELLRVKTRLREDVSFEKLSLASLSEEYHSSYRPSVAKAESMLGQGDTAGALREAKSAARELEYLATSRTRLKDTRKAAEQLGIPGFADKYDEVVRTETSDEAAEAILAATRELWDYTTRTALGALEERLLEQGVVEPDKLELAGDHELFWPSGCLNELGRVLEEVSLSLRWCRYELDRGRGEEALRYLWACRGMQGVSYRWTQLSAALKDTGYDCSPIIQDMLRNAECTRLGKSLDSAMRAVQNRCVTPETVQRVSVLVVEMEQMLVRVIPFMSENDLVEWKGGSTEVSP